MTQLTFEELGNMLKLKGQKSVLGHNKEWAERALEVIREVARTHETFTFDDVRTHACLMGLQPPVHPNAYGAVMAAAKKDGYVWATGQYTQSTQPQSHGRHIPIWQSRIYGK